MYNSYLDFNDLNYATIYEINFTSKYAILWEKMGKFPFQKKKNLAFCPLFLNKVRKCLSFETQFSQNRVFFKKKISRAL